MKDICKLLIKIVSRTILKLFYIFPIKNNKIFFMSNFGKNYNCNPKYIYESMIEDSNFSNIDYIWCFKNKEDKCLPKNNSTKTISKKNLFVYFYHLLTSRVIIYNCGGFSYAPIRKKQFLVETWHGGGVFKKVGLTVQNKSNSSKIGIKLASKDIKLYLSSCECASKNVIRESMGYKGEILDSGSPRNDMFFNSLDKNKMNELKKKLKIDSKKNIVLYAPTFKGREDKAVNIKGEYETINPLVIKTILKEKFGGDWIFLTRGHQYAGKIKLNGEDYDVSSYENMQDILLISDVLITDYSSSMWDFGIMRKPCFLFVSDLDDYKNNERGFYINIKEWPGIICKNNEELSYSIMNFSKEKYNKKIENYFKKVKSYEKGTACSDVKNRILKEIEHDKKI